MAIAAQAPGIFYEEKLLRLQSEIKTLNRQILWISWGRILLFLLAIAGVYGFLSTNNMVWMGLSVAVIIAFVLLLPHHQRLYNRREFAITLSEVNQNEMQLMHGQASLFYDGQEFASFLPFADDLDLFGKHSLYEQLNRCTTARGKKLLANSLIDSPTDQKRILNLQEAVQCMAIKPDFNQHIISLLMLSARNAQYRDYQHREEDVVYLFQRKLFAVLRYALPVMTILSLIQAAFSGNYTIFSLMATVSLLFAFAQQRKMQLLAAETDGLGQAMKSAGEVFELLLKQKVQGEVLENCTSIAAEAKNHLNELSVIAEWFDRRSNLPLFVLGNSIFSYDLQLGLRYEDWKKRCLHKMPEWLEALGRLEMLISYGTFAFNHPDFCYPAPCDTLKFDATALGHPLIPAKERVNNDVLMVPQQSVVLITGSNMSGKSTWLRTLGINILLAQTGAPVCASAMQWKPMPVLSSLRQSDSLHENTSLFMNELKQLKHILEKSSGHAQALVLLDEVLRGTNSEDKYAGSLALIKRLCTFNGFAVVATHDLKLSKLEYEPSSKVVNYCFESRIENGQLHFDYTIRKGVAVNRNATWLMQQMGIVDQQTTAS